jgi:hypothetical protein
MSCNAPLPDYKFTRELFQPDWGCSHCAAPIGGQAPDLLTFLELREQAQPLERAFDPLVRWSEEVNRSTVALQRLNLCPRAPRRYARALMESAICSVSRPPEPAIAPQFKVLCLTWRLRLRPPRPELHTYEFKSPDRPISASTSLTEFFGRFGTSIHSTSVKREPDAPRECTTVLVYEATIYRIQQWLIERHARLGLQTSLHDHPKFDNGRVITAGWDKYELSYLLLRLWLEGGVTKNWTVAAGLICGLGSIYPSFAAIGGRVLRIPLRAAILAAYGTVVCAVSASKLTGEFFALPARGVMEAALACGYETDYLHHTGVVVMPVTEDLMTQFPEMRSRLDEMFSDSWIRISAVPFDQRRRHLDSQPARRSPLP